LFSYNRPVKSIPLANESNSSQSSAVSIDTSLSTKNAFNRINETRKNLGLTVLTENALLDTTAQKSVQLLASNTTDSSQILDKVKNSGYNYKYVSVSVLSDCKDVTCIDQLFTGNDKNKAQSSQWDNFGIGMYTSETNTQVNSVQPPTLQSGLGTTAPPSSSTVQGGINNNTSNLASTTYIVIIWAKSGVIGSSRQALSSPNSIPTPTPNSTYNGSTIFCPSGGYCPSDNLTPTCDNKLMASYNSQNDTEIAYENSYHINQLAIIDGPFIGNGTYDSSYRANAETPEIYRHNARIAEIQATHMSELKAIHCL
jgi:hypothetical protein